MMPPMVPNSMKDITQPPNISRPPMLPRMRTGDDDFHGDEDDAEGEQQDDRSHDSTSTIKPNSETPTTFTGVPASAKPTGSFAS